MTGGPKRRVLVLSTFQDGNANVIRDYLFSFHAYSQQEYRYVFDCRILDGETDFSGYDVILIFWSLYLLGPHLGPEARAAIRRSPALKVLLLQDEYRNVREFNAAMDDLGVQVMLTCVDPRDHETFYPRASIPSLEGVYTVLTGYVPDYLQGVRPPPDAPRPVDIGYRAREVPFYLGDLGREKTTVARRFKRLAWEAGFRADISDREADRVYGRAWLVFLRSCRFALGSGSGASVVDFTGEIRRRCDEYLATRPDATYEEVRERFFADVEGRVVIDTISPRIFESAALGSTLVLHEGPYAGILVPDVHYIRVRKDYSNVSEVLDRMRDDAFCRRLADAAHQDLVASGQYSYRAFARRFDEILDAHARAPRVASPGTRTAFYWSHYWRHGQGILPCGAGFLALPSVRFAAAVPWKVARRAYGRLRKLTLPNAPSVPHVRRFSLKPHLPHVPDIPDLPHPDSVPKALVAARLVLGAAELRGLLGRWSTSRELRRGSGLGQLVRELTHLALIRRELTVPPGTGPGFGIAVEISEEKGVLRVVSRSAGSSGCDGDRRNRNALEMADALLRKKRLEGIVWDHCAVGRGVPYRTAGRTLRIAVGEDGVASWSSLVSIGKAHPEAVSAALRAVLLSRPEERPVSR